MVGWLAVCLDVILVGLGSLERCSGGNEFVGDGDVWGRSLDLW